MLFDMSTLDAGRSYKLLASTVVPRPIAWVVSCDSQDRLNAAPYSLFNFFGGHPPVVCLGMGQADGRDKDSLANIRVRGEFVINLVPQLLVDAMNTTAVPFAPDVDELAMAGLDTSPCACTHGRRIATSPVTLECRLQQLVPLPPSSTLVVANVVAMQIDDALVRDAQRCHIETSHLGLVGRMESPGWYTRTGDRFKRAQQSVLDWEKSRAPQDR